MRTRLTALNIAGQTNKLLLIFSIPLQALKDQILEAGSGVMQDQASASLVYSVPTFSVESINKVICFCDLSFKVKDLSAKTSVPVLVLELPRLN